MRFCIFTEIVTREKNNFRVIYLKTYIQRQVLVTTNTEISDACN